MKRQPTPMQPIELVDKVARFRRNRIVGALFDFAHAKSGVVGYSTPYEKLDLNVIAAEVLEGKYTREEYEQLLQLVGMSVCGVGEVAASNSKLVSKKTAETAQDIVDDMLFKRKARR